MAEVARSGSTSSTGAPALHVAGVSVTFGPVRALDEAELVVRPGTIHALLGGNGSGKSTLIKVLAGVQAADHGGRVQVHGIEYRTEELTPAVARHAGLRFVHQDIGIFDGMTVAENFALYARYPVRAGGVAWRQLHRQVARVLHRFEIDAGPRTPVNSLRPAAQTMLAIARALHDDSTGSQVLVLDEPTATLPSHEAEFVLDALRRRAATGQTILFVGHRLAEVFSVTDELTVLRDGVVAVTGRAADIGLDRTVEAMAGRRLDRAHPAVPVAASKEQPAVVVRGLDAGPLRDIDLDVRPGEIVGIAGLLGSGRSSLLRALFGDLAASGAIRVGSFVGPFSSPTKAMRAGVAYVPEDRHRDASFIDHSVRENLSMAVVGGYFRRLRMHRGAEIDDSERLARQFLVKSAGTEKPFTTLSGGNQQKVILARWIRRRPRLLLLDEPTQGVDVVARTDIYQLIRRCAAEGSSVIVVSSDFEELCELCDRIVALNGGRTVGELAGDARTPELVLHRIQSLGKERST